MIKKTNSFANRKTLSPNVRILDNTMRDGEQTPGVVFSKQDKIDIAKALCACGISDAEIGFPAVSDSERASIKAVIEESLPIRLYGLCRLNKEDINCASECGLKYVTIFLPGSTAYIEKNLKIKSHDVVDTIKHVVSYAVGKGLNVKFSCENASRMELEILTKYYGAAIQMGVKLISFPDTAGVMIPSTMYERVKILRDELKVDISIHCHNDMGLATANTLAAAEAGAIELQGCVNGLGERAGNAPLEEIAIAIMSQYDSSLEVNLSNLKPLSDLVYEKSGLQASFNKPVFGRNVFRHESAIHANSILRGENIYEAFSPALVGRSHEIVLGKHCGLASLEHYLENTLHIKIDRDDMKRLLSHIKEISEKKETFDIKNVIAELGLAFSPS